MPDSIKYRGGFKYQLTGGYSVRVGIRPSTTITAGRISLDSDGLLTINDGYAWDGPSGPTVDTKTFMRGSLVHDALYQLMRWEKLPQGERDAADKELRRICIEDGMWRVRAWCVYQALKLGGKGAASPKNKKQIYGAPK